MTLNKQKTIGLTVVIPVVNRQIMLLRAIESVKTSQAHCVEIIVIDDGSDVKLQALLPYENTCAVKIRVYRFDKNKGPQAARNLGIRRAKYSHIAFLDSDDEFLPNKIDVILSILQRQENCDVIFHSVHGMRRYGVLANFWDKYLRSIIPFHWLCTIYNPVVTPALIVKRCIRLGLPRIRHCEDWFFILRYVDSKTVVHYVNQNLAIVHRAQGTAGGLSEATWKMRKGEFSARTILLRQFCLSGIIRYILGTVVGGGRVIGDLLRRRYRFLKK